MKIEFDLQDIFNDEFLITVRNEAVFRLLTEEVKKQVREMVVSELRDRIRKTATEFINEAINKPVKRCDAYGDPTGEVATLAELIEEQFEKKMNKNQSLYQRNSPTRIQELIKDYAIVGLEQSAKDALEAINAEAKQQVQETIKEIVAKQLTKNVTL